jgi:DNA polymerase-3 subunit delta'
VGWGIIGNERAVAALSRLAGSPSPPHAYLLTGPDRVGKGTLARRLAQLLNCLAEEPERPCGQCAQCQRTEAGTHSDLLMVTVDASGDGPQRKAIGVDQVREVERAVSLSPFEGRRRVVIIDPADAMTVEAQNALLKTLEEPPPQVVFVLVSAREDRLLPTVHSRCRRVGLSLLPRAVLEAALLAQGLEPERAHLLARLSGGRPGWALEAAREPALLQTRAEAIGLCRQVARMSVRERLELADRLSAQFQERREALLEKLALWREWWRDVVLIQHGAEDSVGSIDMMEPLRQDAAGCAPQAALEFVRALGSARRYLEMNVQARLVLDWLLMLAPAVGKEQMSGARKAPPAGVA